MIPTTERLVRLDLDDRLDRLVPTAGRRVRAPYGQALIEREVRRAMQASDIHELPLDPWSAPPANPGRTRASRLSSSAERHNLLAADQPIRAFHPELTQLQLQLLDLLAVPPGVYLCPAPLPISVPKNPVREVRNAGPGKRCSRN